MNKIETNVSITKSGNNAIVTVTDNIFNATNTFHVQYNKSGDRRFESLEDVSKYILDFYSTQGICLPSSLIDFNKTEAYDINKIKDQYTLSSEYDFLSLRFDVPADEFNTFESTRYVFIASNKL